MHSPLRVEAYRHLLKRSPTDRGDDTDVVASRLLLPLAGGRFDALKAAVRRTRKRPTTRLASLDPLDSPQHTYRAPVDDDDPGESDESEARRSRTRRPTSPALSPLPPLVVNVLERKRLFLNAHGDPVVGVEEILQLQDRPVPSPLKKSPLQLIAVPRKVFEDDEIALMPCHTLHYRDVPSLAVEKWKEPLRDRDKHWRDDELAMTLATHGGRTTAHATKMTRSGGFGNVRKGTWRKLDSQRLQIKSSQSTRHAVGAVPEAACVSTGTLASPRDVSQPGEVLLRVQGAMISRTYCVVTIYGVGIYGRLYSEGLADRPQGANRFLRIAAYAPNTSATASLRVSLSDLAWVFEAHPDLLAPGRKQTVLTKVVSLLYFQYPEDTDVASPLDVQLQADEEAPSPRGTLLPVLCISPDEKLNEAARRRLEREERLRREDEERLRVLALLLQQPRRARHRVVCQLRRVSGHTMLVSIYHFPAQVRNFLVVAYHPRSSRTLTIAVGVTEAASLSGVVSPPHTWTPPQTTQIAASVVPRLFVRATKSTWCGERADPDLYRVALAINDDRMGAYGAWLALPEVAHAETKKLDVVAKYKKDGQQALQLSLDHQLAQLELDATTTAETLRAEIANAEAALAALQKRDAELQERIEDINSGTGMGALARAEEPQAKQEKQHQHELRRGHKAARKTLKDESKALQARIAAWKRERDVAKEHVLLATDKAQTTFDKALDVLTQQAVTATLPLWFDPLVDRKTPRGPTERGGNRQRRRLLRAEIREQCVSLASGACRLRGRAYRFSVFAELSPHAVVRPSVMRPSVVRPSHDVDAAAQEQEEHEEDEDEAQQAEVLAEEQAPVASDTEWFQLSFYDASTSRAWSLRVARLEWLALTKSQHDAQLAIAALRVPTSSVAQQVAALDESYDTSRHRLVALKPLKKNDKKKRHLMDELRKNRHARRVLWRDHAPWDKVVRALCDRLDVADRDDGLVLDRCIYRATLAIVSLAQGEGDDADGVVACEVWVTQCVHIVSFHARDTTTQEEWTLAYPDSVELVKEFAVETQLELQLHLEAIAMTLLLYTDTDGASEEIGDDDGNGDKTRNNEAKNERSPQRRTRKMRFEE